MKRLIALILALSFLLCFAGCNKDDEDAPSSSTKTKSVMPVTETKDETDTTKSNSAGTGSYVSSNKASNNKVAQGSDNQQQAQQPAQQAQQQAQQQSQQQAQQPQQQQPQGEQQGQQQGQQQQQPQSQQQQPDINPEKIVANLIPDQDVISALMKVGGEGTGQIMVAIYNKMTPEHKESVKNALATATDSAGNIDYTQFESLISSFFSILGK